MAETATPLKRTPLHNLHTYLGARLVPFAGYEMPVQYEGVKAEHLWTRSNAGLFDVSHMGPCFLSLNDKSLSGNEAHAAIASIIERVVPSDIAGLKPGKARLSVLLNDEGGILDDLIITRPRDEADQGTLYIVVNGAVKEQDFALIAETAGSEATLRRADTDHALIAIQGPGAERSLMQRIPYAKTLGFMQSMTAQFSGEDVIVSRCGYTGEDGFELLLPASWAASFAMDLISETEIKPIGLGARDSLRLEAGLCLYGNDMDASRTPVEADLTWVIQKSRRERADFPGAAKILNQIANGTAEKRIGIKPLERAPAREGTEVFKDGERIGIVTSGGFGPSVDHPVAMGYVASAFTEPGTPVELVVRGKPRPAEIVSLPFVAPNYKR